MAKLFRTLRDSNLTGGSLAALLFVSSRYTVWPMYLRMREQWVLLNEPRVLFWFLGALYFGIWVWLVMFLAKEYKQYPGMSMDALFGGALLVVASALRDADVLSDLSKKGFGAAAWVVFLGAGALLVRNFACMSRMGKKTDEPSAEGASPPAA